MSVNEVNSGATGRIRTVDLRITSALLYQLSYGGSSIRERGRKKVYTKPVGVSTTVYVGN